ncbi:alkaline-phosphatase-like protein [Kockovaella imperatae]|uniref:Alkaline-phosphatase-like protein n=1 Tax=Kockovaella imperatae TaxID=4999 RepID=A0A1Y1UIX2_9TREE|nr:alkaline-phosphatase-like protein [Kockovaella imperatae]ORX38013.1 alkaline-phosphatase-like protein [Kockovaella imperatae]
MPQNVLLIIADDLGKYINSYGCQSVTTPNLTKFTDEAVRFTHAFACTPSCSGSRSTIFTGLHTHENGQYGLAWGPHGHFQTYEHVESMPRLFNEAGYLTGVLGKVHVGPPAVYPWKWMRESESRDVAWIADQAKEFFQEAGSDAFHLTVAFHDPHRDVKSRGGFANDWKYDPRVELLDVKESQVEVPPWLTDCAETRQELVEYYKAIHRFDQGVGMVLQALADSGLADSTLVMITSDNGPPFINSKTTLYEAGIDLPLLIRRPGGPKGIVNPNMVSFTDLLPTMLDWAQIRPKMSDQDTEIHLFKASPSPRRGRSLLSILSDHTVVPSPDWQDAVFGSHTFHEFQNYWPTRIMRTRRFKYHRNIAWQLDFPFATDLYASLSFEGIRNLPPPVMLGRRPFKNYIRRSAEELYDIEADPLEVDNLVDNLEYAETLKEMRTALEKWQQTTRDLFLYRDGASIQALIRYERDGLQVPDRFDMNPEEPGTRGPLVKVCADIFENQALAT